MKKRIKQQKANKLLLLWNSHPRLAILLALIIINIIVIFIFTAILSIVSGNNFFSELAYIFTYTMCSDGIYDFVNSQEDIACFVIKILLTIIQMIIFSGALIGFSTDILQSTIDKNINNLGKINIKGHYVFLNWSTIGPQMIYDLSFLEGEKNVVILTEKEREDVLNSIQDIFIENNKKMKNIRVFIKEGSPTSLKHLNDISIDKANYVGILLTNHIEDNANIMSANDLAALKSLLNILSISTNANIVVETENSNSVSQIEKLIKTLDSDLNERIIVFSHKMILGNILGKTIINKNFSDIFHHLLSYDGAEFYGINESNVEYVLQNYENCIPITKKESNNNDNNLYVLAENHDSFSRRKDPLITNKSIEYNEHIEFEDFTLFILSDTNKKELILPEIERFNKKNKSSIKTYTYTYNKLDLLMEDVKNISGKKKILLLSTNTEDNDSQDADIFLSSLALKLGGCINDDIEILAEIVNPSNYNSLKHIGAMSVILSNKIISLFMLQLLTHPTSKEFYRDLISTNDENENGVDLDITKAKQLINFETEEIVFSSKAEFIQSLYYASNKTKMCIGFISKKDNKTTYLCYNTDDKEDIIINKEDDLIVISY